MEAGGDVLLALAIATPWGQVNNEQEQQSCVQQRFVTSGQDQASWR